MRRVFISSTSEDLAKYREIVRDAILNLDDTHPVMMEHFQARDANALEVCKTEVQQCDIFIGIYAHRYGYIPPGQSKSITELEYDWATEARMPRYVFFVEDNFGWPPYEILPEEANKYRETKGSDAYKKLEAFKNRVSEEVVWKRFTTPESLAAVVTQALVHERPKPPAFIKAVEAILMALLGLQWLGYFCASCGRFTGGQGPGILCLICPWFICPSGVAGLFFGANLNPKGPGKKIALLSAANLASMFAPIFLNMILILLT